MWEPEPSLLISLIGTHRGRTRAPRHRSVSRSLARGGARRRRSWLILQYVACMDGMYFGMCGASFVPRSLVGAGRGTPLVSNVSLARAPLLGESAWESGYGDWYFMKPPLALGTWVGLGPGLFGVRPPCAFDFAALATHAHRPVAGTHRIFWLQSWFI